MFQWPSSALRHLGTLTQPHRCLKRLPLLAQADSDFCTLPDCYHQAASNFVTDAFDSSLPQSHRSLFSWALLLHRESLSSSHHPKCLHTRTPPKSFGHRHQPRQLLLSQWLCIEVHRRRTPWLIIFSFYSWLATSAELQQVLPTRHYDADIFRPQLGAMPNLS